MADLDCVNRFRVGVQGDRIVALAPMKYRMSADEALNLAAWLVACADPVGSRFLTLFAAVTDQEPADALGAMDRTPAGNRHERGRCIYCGADRTGPTAEGHDPGCPNDDADLGKPPTDHELGREG